MIYTKLIYKVNSKKPYLFIGSKVRGALGYALKNEVCINPSYECKGCFATNECAFYSMYEKQNIQHDYRLDFKLYDDSFKFSLLLFNGLQNAKDILNKSLLASLKEYEDIEIKQKVKKLKTKKFSSVIKLNLSTPLRIKKNNKFAINENEIDINDILLSIYKRDIALSNKPFTKLEFNTKVKTVSKNLRYKELTRRSNKQNTKMNMGGLMGEIVLNKVDKKTYNLLKLGEVIGVGKSTVFGLGKIKVEDIG